MGGHPKHNSPWAVRALRLASCYSGSSVGLRLERDGTAPPSCHGCASRSSLRAGFAKELHSQDIIFGKKQLSSEPGATLSLKPWLSGLLLWEVLVDTPSSDLAILLDSLCLWPPHPIPIFLPASTIPSCDLFHPSTFTPMLPVCAIPPQTFSLLPYPTS